MIDLLFSFLSFSTGPFWLILFFIPRNEKAMRAFDAYLYLLTGLFVVQTVPIVPELLPAIASPTLPVIQSFLGSPTGTVGAWNHMILGDLWIGRWVCHDAIKLETPIYIRLPTLIVILFFGPLGLALHLFYRLIFKRQFRLSSDF